MIYEINIHGGYSSGLHSYSALYLKAARQIKFIQKFPVANCGDLKAAHDLGLIYFGGKSEQFR
jgi:hypothetical protein